MESFIKHCVLFLSLCLSFSMLSLAEKSTQGSSAYKDSVKMKKQVLLSDLSSPDVDLADIMPMDAADGPRRTCSPGGACAFQPFRTIQGQFAYLEVSIPCECPEYQECVEVGVNNKRCFIYYGCRNFTGDVTTTEAGVRNASTFSQFAVSATSMVPQNSATEPGQPVTFKFEGSFPPSMNCEL